jgi:RNA polymerase sigma factor (sigma-70 family)
MVGSVSSPDGMTVWLCLGDVGFWRRMADDVMRWIGNNLLPLEAEVRGWLRKRLAAREDEDDLIQEAYCRIAATPDLKAVQSARAYFFATVRNLILERARREKIVRIEAMAEFDVSSIIDEEPSAERLLDGRTQLELVRRMIDSLPPRCRDVFILRKFQQLGQRETASRLGVTENVVEKEVARGMRLLLAMMVEPAEHKRGLEAARR